MKIAQIVCQYRPYFSGMSNAVFEVSSKLISRGHDVTVYTQNFDPSVSVDDEAQRLKPVFSYGNAAFIPTIGKHLKNYDVVHLHYPFFGTAGAVKRFKKKHPEIPLIITYHMDNRASGLKGFVFAMYAKYYMKGVLDAADALIGSTLDFIENSDAKGVFQNNPQKWTEIPFGVDLERFTPGNKSIALAEQLGFDVSIPTVIFVGGMDSAHHFKGVNVLLRALKLLSKEKIPFQAVFVGDGDLRGEYERVAGALFLKTWTRFVGRVEDSALPDYYRLANVCVLPSTSPAEAFGMVLLEAMACGCATIGSDLPGVREIASQGGVTFPIGDEVALAEALVDYFRLSQEKKQQIAELNRQIVEEKYSWKQATDLYEQLYAKLVGQ